MSWQFGKGLYFADLVSKSAQYCYTTKKNPTGLMLLSEVALGKTYDLKSAKVNTNQPSLSAFCVLVYLLL